MKHQQRRKAIDPCPSSSQGGAVETRLAKNVVVSLQLTIGLKEAVLRFIFLTVFIEYLLCLLNSMCCYDISRGNQ
jgi:hypothetical protein